MMTPMRTAASGHQRTSRPSLVPRDGKPGAGSIVADRRNGTGARAGSGGNGLNAVGCETIGGERSALIDRIPMCVELQGFEVEQELHAQLLITNVPGRERIACIQKRIQRI